MSVWHLTCNVTFADSSKIFLSINEILVWAFTWHTAGEGKLDWIDGVPHYLVRDELDKEWLRVLELGGSVLKRDTKA